MESYGLLLSGFFFSTLLLRFMHIIAYIGSCSTETIPHFVHSVERHLCCFLFFTIGNNAKHLQRICVTVGCECELIFSVVSESL